MGIIQNETERMIAHTHSLEDKVCDGECNRCVNEQRMYGGLLNRRNIYDVRRNLCAPGLSFGFRMKQYAENDESKGFIEDAASILIADSMRKPNPEDIKRDARIIRTYLKYYQQV